MLGRRSDVKASAEDIGAPAFLGPAPFFYVPALLVCPTSMGSIGAASSAAYNAVCVKGKPLSLPPQ
jgi:hypothetical protein